MTISEDIHSQLIEQGASKVPEDFSRLFHPATIWISEWRDYWLNLTGVDRLRVGTNELLSQHDNWFLLSFKNQVGLAQIQPLAGGRKLGSPVKAEVVTTKFPTLGGHFNFFKTLLDDLFQRTVRLPFSIQSSTQRSVQEAVQPPTPLFTYHFLCQHGKEIASALEIILALPHCLLVDEETYVSLDRVRSVDSDVILDIFQNPSTWVKAAGHPIAEKLGGYVPTRIRQSFSRETLDTPENRFVLNFLRLLLNAIDDLVFQPWWGKVPNSQRNNLQELRSLLQHNINHPVFDEVGSQNTIPLTSQVLLRKEGYRQMLSLWQQYNQARKPLFQPLQKAIDVRNIAELYEYWAFFTLAEWIGAELQISPVVEILSSDEHGLNWTSRAKFGRQGCLEYNHTFRSSSTSFHSYSTSMRPDFTWVADGNPRLVFDAKFGFDVWDWVASEDEAGSQSTKVPKLDDLYKMHTYRDALGLQAAVILYPGDMKVFYDLRSKPHKRIDVHLHQLLNGELSGIGALPMQPIATGEQ